MGAVSSKNVRRTSHEGSNVKGHGCDFPNARLKCREISSWSLIHQCSLDNWKQGHAEAANFPDSILSCDRNLHKDCSAAFCMSRQGVINIDCSTSMFSIKRRAKFSKMAEHFEYNHIPAQMSSVNHFRVKSVLCFRDSLVVLHLSRNGNSQFGILDLGTNKFLGVFGKQPFEYENENFSGELSPDQSKCLVLKPILTDVKNGFGSFTSFSQIIQTCTESIINAQAEILLYGQEVQQPEGNYSFQMNVVRDVPLAELLLYDMSSKHLLSRVPLMNDICHFSFNPRHSWSCLAVTNFGHHTRENSLSLVEVVAPLPFDCNLTYLPMSDVDGTVIKTDNSATQSDKRHVEQVQSHSGITDWMWNITSLNYRLGDHWYDESSIPGETRGRSSSDISTYQKLVNLQHSRDGRLLVATMLEHGECRCREKKSTGIRSGGINVGTSRGFHQIHSHHFRGHRHNQLPMVNCSLYVFDADSARTLRCIQYHRYACHLHTCPTNYVPIFSACGTRMALVVDAPTDLAYSYCPFQFPTRSDSHGLSDHASCKRYNQDFLTSQHVQVYRLPLPAFCLQALCRSVLLESKIHISEIMVPPKIFKYLKFGPEFH